MGLLDVFLNPNDEQRRGLLGASAALLQAGGPSRVPISTGQALGSALQAYEQGVQSYQDRQQQQVLYGLKMQGLEGELADKDLLRGRQAAIASDLKKLRTGAPKDDATSPPAGYDTSYNGTPYTQTESQNVFAAAKGMNGYEPDKLNQVMALSRQGISAEQAAGLVFGGGAQQSPSSQAMASAMPGGPMSPKIGGPDWLQNYQQQAGDQMPAPQASSMQMPSTPQSGATQRVNHTQALVQRLMDEADIYASHEDFKGAKERYELAQKWMPEVKSIETVLQGDKPVRVITFKDGTEHVSEYGAKPDITEVDLNDRKKFVDKNRVAPGTEYMKGPSFSDRNAAARLQLERQNQNGGDDAASFTTQAIDNAAARYNVDGTLPPMGMGKAGAAGRTKILNRAAELKAGVDPAQQRLDQLNNKGDIAARNTAVRSFGVGKDGQAVQSANTALNHLATVRELAIAQKSGDVQAFNKVARALGAQFGQTAPTNLSAALIMVGPEISKAVVGVAGTGHERDQAIQALNPNGSPDQVISGTGVMEELFGGRLTEAKRTYKRTTKLDDFDSTMLSPAAQAVLSRAEKHANQAGGGAAPPAGGQFSVQAPNGKTFYFKTAKDMNNFKLTAGIR